jgi:putative ABC transport system permease protein
MKLLIKNTLKNVWNRKLQVISTIALIMLGTAQFVGMQLTVSNINDNINEYDTVYNREDARMIIKPTLNKEDVLELYKEYKVTPQDAAKNDFITNKTKYNISIEKYNDAEADRLAQKYNFKYELESSKIAEFGTNQYIRYMIEPKEINKIIITSGAKPQSNNEIILSERYGTLNNIQIGDNFKGANDKDYKITGFFRSPAYSVVINNPTNKMPDAKNETLAIVSEEEFNTINIEPSSFYDFKFNASPENLNDTIEEIRDESSVVYLLDKANNPILNILDIRRDLIQTISYIIPPVLISISILIFITLIRKQIDSQRRQIGVLKALGYSSNKILFPYTTLPIVVLMIALPLGLVIGVGLSKVFINQLATSTQLQPISAQLNVPRLIQILILLITFFEIVVFTSVRNKLRKPAINLLHDGVSAKINPMTKVVEKIFRYRKFETRLRALNAGQSVVKIGSILMLGIITSLLMLVSLGINSIFAASKAKVENNQYQYSVLLNSSYEKNELDNSDNPQYIYNERIKLENVNDRKINTVVNLNRTETKYFYQQYSSKEYQNKQQYDNGVVLNQTLAVLYDVNIGDTIKIKIGDNEKEVKVFDINQADGTTPTITTSYQFAKENLGINNELVNRYYLTANAKEPSKDNDEKIKSVTTKTEEIEGIEKSQQSVQAIFTMIFIIVGMFVFVIFTLVASFIIEDNRKNIAMMQILGYSQGKIQRLILNIYFPILIIGLLIGMSLSVIANAQLQTFFTKLVRQDMPIQNTMLQYIIVFVYILGIYVISMIQSRKKVMQIDIKEIMS